MGRARRRVVAGATVCAFAALMLLCLGADSVPRLTVRIANPWKPGVSSPEDVPVPTVTHDDPTDFPKLPPTSSTNTSLELVNGSAPLYLWERTEVRGPCTRCRNRTASDKPQVRMACLYAGFMRNWEWMLGTCREMQTSHFCGFPNCAKLFGSQRKSLLQSTDCDVFISTWHIRGAGRFSTTAYDMAQTLPLDRVLNLYKDWLTALHVQNYSLYESVWRDMHLYPRVFPQSRPAALLDASNPRAARWQGRDQTRHFLRRNDYSQAYKHWCVLQLVDRSAFKYDVYFRLRTDLRMTRIMRSLRFAPGTSETTATVEFKLEAANGSASIHTVSDNRLHVNNFDVGDFGFLGRPAMIRHLSTIVWDYCRAPPVEGMQPVKRVAHSQISEYNLMLWRAIFDAKWDVDSGMRYLWVSRSRKRCKKKKGQGGAGHSHAANVATDGDQDAE